MTDFISLKIKESEHGDYGSFARVEKVYTLRADDISAATYTPKVKPSESTFGYDSKLEITFRAVDRAAITYHGRVADEFHKYLSGRTTLINGDGRE